LLKKRSCNSKNPGRTKEINVFKICFDRKSNAPFFIFDLPGFGYANISKETQKEWQKLIDAFLDMFAKKILLIYIQDGRHPQSSSDQIFSDYIEGYNIQTLLVFNKIDKLNQRERSVLDKNKISICQNFLWVKQIHFVSNHTGEGIEQLKLALLAEICGNPQTH
ncbi:MAG: 50S ribosome-binding GTPase, partial [Oligoflexia bacterium]|nr:50S ribosome-binding GTPase [Oligoflexia bacterium]